MHEREQPRVPKTEEECLHDSGIYDELWSAVYDRGLPIAQRRDAILQLHDVLSVYRSHLLGVQKNVSSMTFYIEHHILNQVFMGLYHYRKAED